VAAHIGAGAEEGTGDRNDVSRSYPRQCAGVPFGTALGEAVGWRSTFWAVVVIGFHCGIALDAWLPRDIPLSRMQFIHEARSLGSTQVILAMLISVAVSASLFSVFTYIHADPGERDSDLAARGHVHAAAVRRWTHGG